MKIAVLALLSTSVTADHEGIPNEVLNFKGYMRDYLSTWYGIDGPSNSSSGSGSTEACENNLSQTDAYGDDCSWYDDNADSCGAYDDDDFTASFFCCACGGGLLGGECVDQDDGITDLYGDKCEWYNDNVEECGTYDDDDFTASYLCCACGGGRGGNDLSSSSSDCQDDLSIFD